MGYFGCTSNLLDECNFMKNLKSKPLLIILIDCYTKLLKLFLRNKKSKWFLKDFLVVLGIKYVLWSKIIISKIENENIGKSKIQYKLRDATFSRQRYWGEPIPIYYKDGVPKNISLSDLPLKLPEVDNFLPTKNGDSPLGNSKSWAWNEKDKKVVSNDKINNIDILRSNSYIPSRTKRIKTPRTFYCML